MGGEVSWKVDLLFLLNANTSNEAEAEQRNFVVSMTCSHCEQATYEFLWEGTSLPAGVRHGISTGHCAVVKNNNKHHWPWPNLN